MKRDITVSAKYTSALALLEEVRVLSARGSYEEAIAAGVKGLRLLGIRISAKPGMWPLIFEINGVKRHFSLRKIKGIPNKKTMTNEKARLRVKLMTAMAYSAMRTNMSLWQQLLLKIGNTAMKYGNCPEGVLGYAAFAETALAYLDDEPVAEALNVICGSMLSQETPDEAASMTGLILGSGTAHIFGNWPDTLKILENSAQRTRTTNPSLGFLCSVRATEMTFGAGMPLNEVKGHMAAAKAMDCDGEGNGAKEMMALYGGFMAACTPGTVFEPSLQDFGRRQGLQLPVTLTAAMLKTLYAFGMDDIGGGDDALRIMVAQWKKIKINYIPGLVYGLEALTLCRSCIEADHRFPRELSRLYQLKGIFEFWVKRNPYAYGHVYKVIEGCCYTVERNFYDGEASYEKAIELAEENGSILWKAMTQKILGHHCRYLGRTFLATYHIQSSAESFDLWGHEAMSEHLRRAEGLSLSVNQIADRWEAPESYRISAIDKTLELAAEISYRDGSLEKSFKAVLSTYLTIEKQMIFIEKDGAIIRHSDGVPMENLMDVSKKAVDHVRRHKDPVVINEERKHQIAKYDGYLLDHRRVCLMAVPLLDGDYCAGIYYCERAYSFDVDEQEVVKRLAGHMAFLMNKKEE